MVNMIIHPESVQNLSKNAACCTNKGCQMRTKEPARCGIVFDNTSDRGYNVDKPALEVILALFFGNSVPIRQKTVRKY